MKKSNIAYEAFMQRQAKLQEEIEQEEKSLLEVEREISSLNVDLLLEMLSAIEDAKKSLLQNLQNKIKAHYIQTSFINKQLFDKDHFSLAKHFVAPQLMIDDKPLSNSWQERDLEDKKETITLNKLFQFLKYQDKTIAVSGAEGIGKSTLLNYIAYQWALSTQNGGKTEPWSKFDIVLIVQCRYLQEEAFNANWTDADLLHFACLDSLPVSADEMQQILQSMRQSPKKCLLLFDGFNELPAIKRESMAGRLLTRLFSLPFKKIVTTQPCAINNLCEWFAHDKIVKIGGFKDEDIPAYFKKVLGNTKETTFFIKGLKNSPNTWRMAHTPINAYLLKRWWMCPVNKHNISALAHLSQNDLYKALMIDLFHMYSKKHQLKSVDNKIFHNEDYKTIFAVLGQWAFEGLVRNTTGLALKWLSGTTSQQSNESLLTESVLDKISIEALEQSGLIKQINERSSNNPQYYFLDLTFQKFLVASVVASYLVTGTEKEKARIGNIINRYKFHPNFILVWPFVSGCLKRHSQVLDGFFEQLFIKAPRDWVGIVENALLIQCVEASLSNTELMPIQQQLLDSIMLFNGKAYHTQIQIAEKLSHCPNILTHCADRIMTILKKESIDGRVRVELAKAFVAQLPSWPSPDTLCHQVVSLLEKKTIAEVIRIELAKVFVAQLPLWPSSNVLCHQVIGLLENETITRSIRVELAKVFVAQLPWWPSPESLCHQVVGLLENESIDGDVRSALASAFIAQLPSWPSPDTLCHQVISLLEKKTIAGVIRIELAKAFIAQLPSWPSQEALCHQVIDLLRKEAITKWVRGELAKAFIAQLPSWPSQEVLCNKIVDLLENEAIDEWVRSELAIAFAAQLPSWPSPEALCRQIVGLLEKETINRRVRTQLAKACVAQLSLWPLPKILCQQVVGLLENEAIDREFRGELAKAFVAQLSSWPSRETLCYQVASLLESKTIDGWVRCKLAKALATQLPSWPSPEALCYQVVGLLKNEAIEGWVRCKLATAFVTQLSSWPSPEALCYQVMGLLENKTIDEWVRYKLAKAFAAQLRSWPSPEALCYQVTGLLENETIDRWVRCKLAMAFVAQLPSWPSPEALCYQVVCLLENEAIDGWARCKLATAFVAQLPLWPSQEALCHRRDRFSGK